MPSEFDVLVVEDNPSDVLMLEEALCDASFARFKLSAVQRLADAVALLSSRRFDVVLLDLNLPDSQGEATLQRLTAAAAEVPVVVLTGLDDDALGIRLVKEGAQDYLIKGQFQGNILARAVLYAVERKRAEEALRLERERLDLVIGSIDLGLWYCDLPSNKLLWNATCKRHFGLDAHAEVTIALFYERLHPDERERVREAIESALENRTLFDTEYRTLARESGPTRWVRAIGRGFYDSHGRAMRFDGITIDITEQKRIEEMLKEADHRKDEFLAMLAHELRNPLAPIRNAVQIMKLLAPPESDLHKTREMIARQVSHMARLIDDLLDVSRITQGKIELRKRALELGPIVLEAVEAVRLLIEARRHQLHIALPTKPVWLRADPTRLAQIIGNLLNNAAKYTDEGGEIWLDARQQGEQVLIQVRDNGIGIASNLLPYVFDLFTQAERSLDRTQGGLGVGLTLVKRLVEMHGGDVTAGSEGPGRGSIFTVRLPILPDASAESAGESGKARSPGDRRRILVVDDNVDAAESLAMLLRMIDHEVHVAYDGAAALDLARQTNPELVLLDIGLPEMDGFEVARRLRADQNSQAVLVAVTGYGQTEDRRRSREAGFDHHMVKPIDPEALMDLIRTLPTRSGHA